MIEMYFIITKIKPMLKMFLLLLIVIINKNHLKINLDYLRSSLVIKSIYCSTFSVLCNQ